MLLLLAIATPLVAGELSVHAPSDIKKLLTPWLPDDSGNQRRLQGQLSEILATEGYFSPAFNFEERDGGLNLTIDPGLRTTITGVDVAVDGNIEPKTNKYVVYEKIGDTYYKTPTYMTYDEYLQYSSQESEQNYFQQRSRAIDLAVYSKYITCY